MWGMTDSYVGHDSFKWADGITTFTTLEYFVYTWDIMHSHVGHDALIYGT